MSIVRTPGESRETFPPTRWSLVIAATRQEGAESALALETVCRSYWYPLYAYARSCGQTPHDAQDITQEFFRLLLEKRWLDEANPEKGRLRSFLITALKRFMAKDWRRSCAQRRGGAQTHFAIDSTFAESRYAADANPSAAADELFDRRWALRLLELTLERLEGEFKAVGKSADFAVLKEFLTRSRADLDYSAAAAQLGLTEGAARVAVHRFRRRFRELYRQEVAETLPVGESLEAELRYLAHVLAQS